jgi:hypothetical protein
MAARPKDTRPHPSPWIRAAADFTESLNGTDEIATGKVSVSVPASLFGF